jgi:hypothetical protein
MSRRGFRLAWYRGEQVYTKWYPKSPAGKPAHCEEAFHVGPRTVWPEEPRLCIDNDKGVLRENSHMKRNQWVCQVCAKDVPHHPDDEDKQEQWDV